MKTLLYGVLLIALGMATPVVVGVTKEAISDFRRGVYTGQCSKFCLDEGTTGGGWDPATDECVCQLRYKRKDVIQQKLFLIQPRVKIEPPPDRESMEVP